MFFQTDLPRIPRVPTASRRNMDIYEDFEDYVEYPSLPIARRRNMDICDENKDICNEFHDYVEIRLQLITRRNSTNICDELGDSIEYCPQPIARKKSMDNCDEFDDYVEYYPPLCVIHSYPIDGMQKRCPTCFSPNPEILARCLNVDSKEVRLELKLMIAISYNKEDVVRRILHEKRLDPNCLSDRRSPIYCAVRLGHFEIVKLLLEAGADVKSNHGREGDTVEKIFPLHAESRHGSLELLQLLVSYGADINALDSHRYTPLYLATYYGHSHLIKWMLSVGANVNMLHKSNVSALVIASRLGHLDICRTLIEGGADLSSCDDGGYTALHSAVSYGFESIVKLLLEAGADTTMKVISTNETALHMACSSGSVNIIRMLLRAGISTESRDFWGFTPLLTALDHKYIYSAFFLIKAGANVNAVTNTGIGAMDISLCSKYQEMLTRILIQAGAFVSKNVCVRSEHSTWLETYIFPTSFRPRSLQDLCHVIIRRRLAPRLQTNVDHLPVPAALKRAIALEAVDLEVLNPKYGWMVANVNAEGSHKTILRFDIKGLIFELKKV